MVPWNSHKSQEPVKSVRTAETLVTGEATKEERSFVKRIPETLGIGIKLYVAVDSKFSSALFYCWLATDK